MIEETEIIDAQLECAFGSSMPLIIKSIVNRELDAGIWIDGFESAVTKDALNHDQGLELLNIIIESYPSYRININELKHAVEYVLPQSTLTKPTWLIADDATFVITDSLRVARFHGSNLRWGTPRISYDGIKLIEIKNGYVNGLSWHLSRSHTPDVPFCIDFESGELLSGTVVN